MTKPWLIAAKPPAEIWCVFAPDGSLVNTFTSESSAREIADLIDSSGVKPAVRCYASNHADELNALRTLASELESYCRDSGWHALAREIRLRSRWAASQEIR